MRPDHLQCSPKTQLMDKGLPAKAMVMYPNQVLMSQWSLCQIFSSCCMCRVRKIEEYAWHPCMPWVFIAVLFPPCDARIEYNLLVGFTPFFPAGFHSSGVCRLIIYHPFPSLSLCLTPSPYFPYPVVLLACVWFCKFIPYQPFHHGNYTCLQYATIRKFVGCDTHTMENVPRINQRET